MQVVVIPQNNTFLYDRTNEITLGSIILWNAFLAPEYIKWKKYDWMVNCLIFSICYFQVCKKIMFLCLQKFCSIRKWMMLKIVDKNVFKIMTLSNNLVLFCRFQGHNLTLYDSQNMCFLLKYSLWKLQLELWNTNHKPLNQTVSLLIPFLEVIMLGWEWKYFRDFLSETLHLS